MDRRSEVTGRIARLKRDERGKSESPADGDFGQAHCLARAGELSTIQCVKIGDSLGDTSRQRNSGRGTVAKRISQFDVTVLT
jgi:hypothetical protein